MGANDLRDNLETSHLDQGQLGCGLVTLEKFAEITGLPVGVCLGMANRAYLPTVTLGRRRLINTVALQRELSKKPFVLA
jgi:hypothetical protein